MNTNTQEWTVVGQKNKNTRKYLTPHIVQKNKPIDKMTPDDIYYKNLNKIDYLKNNITDQTKESSTQETLNILGNIVEFAINTMATIVEKATTDISDISDNQKTVIALNTYLENSDEIHVAINSALSTYHENTKGMYLMKKKAIDKIQTFLTTCGISEIPSYDGTNMKKRVIHCHETKTKTKTKTENITTDIIPVKNIMRSYASAIGLVDRGSAIEKQKAGIIKTISPHKTVMVDTGIVSINMPIISKIQDSTEFTFSYIDYHKVFVTRIGNTVFTTGPGNFVNLKKSSGKTKHAKRCLNNQPCQYKKCKYYHDPCIMQNDFNTERNFELSYVMQILGAVKNPTDLLENKIIRDPNFVRDLVQLGGIILLKAAQIKELYLAGEII